MKRGMWKKLRAGTLIAIPADDGRYLIGQILIPGMTFHLQVHSKWIHDLSDCQDALKSPILLFGETTDGELCRERWVICGEAPCPLKFFRPYCVVNSPDGLILCDFDRNVIRTASNADLLVYGYRSSSSSTVFSTVVTDLAKSKIETNKQDLKEDFKYLDARTVAKRCEL